MAPPQPRPRPDPARSRLEPSPAPVPPQPRPRPDAAPVPPQSRPRPTSALPRSRPRLSPLLSSGPAPPQPLLNPGPAPCPALCPASAPPQSRPSLNLGPGPAEGSERRFFFQTAAGAFTSSQTVGRGLQKGSTSLLCFGFYTGLPNSNKLTFGPRWDRYLPSLFLVIVQGLRSLFNRCNPHPSVPPIPCCVTTPRASACASAGQLERDSSELTPDMLSISVNVKWY